MITASGTSWHYCTAVVKQKGEFYLSLTYPRRSPPFLQIEIKKHKKKIKTRALAQGIHPARHAMPTTSGGRNCTKVLNRAQCRPPPKHTPTQPFSAIRQHSFAFQGSVAILPCFGRTVFSYSTEQNNKMTPTTPFFNLHTSPPRAD